MGLLGPPSIHNSSTSTAPNPNPPMGLTENLSATYVSTGNPCLDFFFHVVPDTPSDQLLHWLQSSWAHDPLTTLKLICNLRGVRGTGKSDKQGFYTSALWLHKNHPKTLALNVKPISDFGYFKDNLEILYRLLQGPEIRNTQKQEWETMKNSKKRKRRMARYLNNDDYYSDSEPEPKRKSPEPKTKSAESKADKKAAMAKKALDRYNQDQDFKLLHDQVSSLFAELLRADMEFLKEGSTVNKISLASKWCPSLDSSYDKATLMCEAIARRVFPREEFVEYEGVEEAHYVYRVRDRLRKEVLVPLHQALQLPEVFMSANKWDHIPYNRVASVAMKLYKKLFYKHDSGRFREYLEKVKRGETTIAAGALLPHEIIAQLGCVEFMMQWDSDSEGEADFQPPNHEVAELQWKRMVDDLAKKGKLKNCMAVCDVSGSMNGEPMEVSVALGLLVSELSEDPWKGKLITFSENPQLQEITGDTLLAKTTFIRRMEWGESTDFQKVFDRILDVAVKGKLKEEDMIQRLFVFSDMEFDQATGRQDEWETDYQVIVRKFKENGYNKVPEIVFWNLRNSIATPVPSNKEGVALVSGFSKNLMTLFLEEEGILTPESVLMKAIGGEEYQKLQVFD